MSMICYYETISSELLEELKKNPDSIELDIKDDTSVDKAWHSIHYALNNKEAGLTNLSQIVLGGHEFGEEGPYGPNRYFSADEVKLMAEEVEKIDFESLLKKEWPTILKDNVYPTNKDDEFFTYVIDHFKGLKEFLLKAAKDNNCVITYIS